MIESDDRESITLRESPSRFKYASLLIPGRW
jgi:hypothetical protein